LGAAVYLNYYFTNEPTLSAGADASTSDDGALGEASFVNGSMTDVSGDVSSEPSKDTTAKEDYFDKARSSRTAAREESLRLVQQTLGGADASAEDKKKATDTATVIAQNVLQESNIENLILAKGFDDCVVFIDGENCSVVVQAELLQQQECLQIMEIVVSQSSVAAKNVQIMASKA
jgi:stage III sporulation protein AH